MRNVVLGVMLAVAAGLVHAPPASGQSRADSAAVVLHAAQQFRAAGDEATARALLLYLQRQYSGTTAAAEADRLLGVARRAAAAEGPGRTELMVWSATYGAWLGIAVPLMAEAEGPEAYGVGLLLATPAAFLAARAYANATNPTEGQARAITFGGTWGTYQGLGWAEVLRLGDRTPDWCDPRSDPWCHEEAHMPTRVAMAVLGGFAGMGTGAVLGRKPITAGTAAAVSTSAMWGTWFGWGSGFIAGLEDRTLLTTTLLAGNAALLAAGIVAPDWNVSESRVRMVDVSGLIGGLAGAGIAMILTPEDDRVAIGIPLVTSAMGLAAGVHYTRDRFDGGDGASPGGALINRDGGGRWAVRVPAASLALQRGDDRLQPAAYVPLLQARF
jgi:hypothetical protein